MSTLAPPRVTYWCGIWRPTMEGLSREIATVRTALAPGSPVVSFSTGQASGWSRRDGVLRLSGRRWILLRLLAAALEPTGALSHVWGGLGSWHLLRAVGRRPVLLTASIDSGRPAGVLPSRVRRIVAESELLARRIEASGVSDGPVAVVRPGVDLEHFRPGALPAYDPFRVLFASTPADAGDLAARGIPHLLELARGRSDVSVKLLWRPWGDLEGCRAQLDILAPPPNAEIAFGAVADMRDEYRASHVVACLYARGHGKSCPVSILEGLASGRPAIVTEGVGIARLVEDSGAGRVVGTNAAELSAAIDTIRADLPGYAARARALAERELDHRTMVDAYRKIYRQTAS